MPVGLQVFNDQGDVQITSDYRNMHLVDKGSVTLAGPKYASMSSIPYYDQTVTRPNMNMPLMAIRSANLVALDQPFSSPGVSVTWRFISLSPGTVDWWLFDLVAPQSSGLGLQVFTAAGDLAFDSGHPPLRLHSVNHMPQTEPASLSLSLPTGRTWAAIQTMGGRFVRDTEIDPYPVFIIEEKYAMSRFSGTSFFASSAMAGANSTKYAEYTWDGWGYTLWLSPNPVFLIADVTGI